MQLTAVLELATRAHTELSAGAITSMYSDEVGAENSLLMKLFTRELLLSSSMAVLFNHQGVLVSAHCTKNLLVQPSHHSAQHGILPLALVARR